MWSRQIQTDPAQLQSFLITDGNTASHFREEFTSTITKGQNLPRLCKKRAYVRRRFEIELWLISIFQVDKRIKWKR